MQSMAPSQSAKTQDRSLAKAKLVAANDAADDASPNASSAKPVKRARATATKTKSSGSKKAAAPVDDDEEEEEEEEDSGDELNEPAPKRAKKLSKK